MEQTALHDLLCGVLKNSNCYYQPPSTIRMKYPCIVYHHSDDSDRFADNTLYKEMKRYTVTIIDSDPDSEIPSRLKRLKYCSLDRNYTMDGLNHFVYTLYFNGPRFKEDK